MKVVIAVVAADFWKGVIVTSKNKVSVSEDGSIFGADGKILFFSPERFKREIVEGDGCFICGCSPKDHAFNDEHVIPEWVLREFELQNHQIGLPNLAGLTYSKYKIPCCVSCNSLLGESFETPVSKLLKGGYKFVLHHVKHHGPQLFFLWLALIFFKTHLKDRALRFSLDARKGAERIADNYDWDSMHHIHCIVRSFYTRIPLDGRIMGSFFLLPAQTAPYIEPYDYVDLFFSKTILFRFNEVALFCVLDDACATYNLMKNGPLSRINSPLSPIQVREIMALMSYQASLVSPKPRFFTGILDGFPVISVSVPEFVKTTKGSPKRFGEIMHRLCSEDVKRLNAENKDYILQNLKQGIWSFTFNEKGEYFKHQ